MFGLIERSDRMSEPIPDEAFDGLAGRTRGGIGGRKEVCLRIDLLLMTARLSLTGSVELVLPDRAPSDLSREAGLNDMIPAVHRRACNGFMSNASMAS